MMLRKHVEDRAAQAEGPHNLSWDDMLHLHGHVFGGLMRKVIPDDTADKLVTAGYLSRRVGGLVPTHQGVALIISHSEDRLDI